MASRLTEPAPRLSSIAGDLARREQEHPMDFIERIFGFAPDGRNGMFELLLFAIPIAGIIVLWRKRRTRN
jgi:hypothetical protein